MAKESWAHDPHVVAGCSSSVVCGCGVYVAIAVSRYLDDVEWREWHAELEQWRAACDALEMDDIPDVGPCAEEDADT